MATPDVLEIYLNERHVGTLVAISAQSTIFTFEPSYIEDDLRPMLSLGFLDSYRRLRVRPGAPGRVIPYFANLLPEGELRTYIAQRAGLAVDNELGLLWVAGQDLPGAIVARDPQGREAPPAAMGTFAPDHDRLLRFSLAGVQLKFSALSNAAGGLTIPVTGRGGNAIVKLPSVHYPDVPANEFAMMQFARALGLNVPDCRLISLEHIDGLPNDIHRMREHEAFVTERFDRSAHGRIHTEDFNQIYRQYPDKKYDNHDYNNMGRDIYRLMGVEALEDFVHRLVFSVAIGNTDMHLKNWSIIYRDERTPVLAPLYDYLCTSVYEILGRNELALKLGPTKHFNEIGVQTFVHFAQRADLSSRIVTTAANTMRDRILQIWPTYRDRLDHLPNVRTRIDELLARVPFFNRTAAGGRTFASDLPGTQHEELA